MKCLLILALILVMIHGRIPEIGWNKCAPGMLHFNGKCKLPCPNSCNSPKSERDCLACLNKGFSDVVHGRFPWIEKSLSKKLEPGAWSEWVDNHCWICMINF